MTEQRRLSIREAAERAGVSTKMIRRRIDSGDLPGYRIKGMRKMVVLEADIDRVFPLERIEPRAPAPPPVRRVPSRRPPARGSREALRSIEERAAG